MAFLPASAAAAWPDLATVEVTDRALVWEVSVATPAQRRVPAAARAFLAELRRTGPGNPGQVHHRDR